MAEAEKKTSPSAPAGFTMCGALEDHDMSTALQSKPATPSHSSLSWGVRLAVFLALFGALAFGFTFALARIFPIAQHKVPPLWVVMLGQLAVLVAAGLPAALMARVEHRSFSDYGLPSLAGKSFVLGVTWGFLALTALLLAIRSTGDFSFDGMALHGIRILRSAAFWGLFFLIVAIFEEFLFRGYTLFTLAQGSGFWPAAVFSSIVFGAVHLANSSEGWMGALVAGMMGLFFCLTLRRTGSLWFAIGFHTAWEWGESYVYSVPNSGGIAPGHLINSSLTGSHWITGGVAGPEASIFTLVLFLLLCLIFDRTHRQAVRA
jgi:membrane protease YdiL (CAAX protease family)